MDICLQWGHYVFFFLKTNRENKETAFLLPSASLQNIATFLPNFCCLLPPCYTWAKDTFYFLFLYLFILSFIAFPWKNILSFLRQKRPSFDLIHLDFFFCTHGCQRRIMRKVFVSFLPIATHFSLFPESGHSKTSKRSSSLGFTLYIPQFLYPI